MDDRELEDILIGTLETRIDHQIEKIDEIISDSEEFADLSIDIWPPKDDVEKLEHLLLGQALADVDWLVATLEEERADIEPGSLDATPLRRAAAQLVERRRDDLEAATRHPDQERSI